MLLLTRQQMMALVHAFENLLLKIGFVFLMGLLMADFLCWFSVNRDCQCTCGVNCGVEAEVELQQDISRQYHGYFQVQTVPKHFLYDMFASSYCWDYR